MRYKSTTCRGESLSARSKPQNTGFLSQKSKQKVCFSSPF